MQEDLLCIITVLKATAWRRLTLLYLECALYKVSDALLLNYVYSNNLVLTNHANIGLYSRGCFYYCILLLNAKFIA